MRGDRTLLTLKFPWHEGRIHGCDRLTLVEAGWLEWTGRGEEDAAQKKVGSGVPPLTSELDLF